jgi:hypothetical protein
VTGVERPRFEVVRVCRCGDAVIDGLEGHAGATRRLSLALGPAPGRTVRRAFRLPNARCHLNGGAGWFLRPSRISGPDVYRAGTVGAPIRAFRHPPVPPGYLGLWGSRAVARRHRPVASAPPGCASKPPRQHVSLRGQGAIGVGGQTFGALNDGARVRLRRPRRDRPKRRPRDSVGSGIAYAWLTDELRSRRTPSRSSASERGIRGDRGP